MSAAILRRGLANGWRGILITAVAVAAMLALALAMYQHIDLSIYDGLPEAVRSVMGIPPHADASLMAYNEMLAAIGALAFVGVGIAVGARGVAGEEEGRTLPLVLATPISRTRFALSKAASLIVLLVLGAALMWALAELAPVLVGAETGDAQVLALMVQLCATAIFHGSLAFAVGAVTGRRGLALAVGAAVMVLGWLGAGLLPMWREGAADWIPWAWFNASVPLVNGVDAGDLARLLGGAALLIGLGVVVFARRELRLSQTGPGLAARLRSVPWLGRVLAPTAKGTSLLGLRLASQRSLVASVALLLGLVMGVSMPPMYESMSSTLGQFAESFPQSMADLFGGGDLTTPAGFLHLETFGMVAPLCVILVAVAAASAGIAGEERSRRMSTLLAAPVSRARVYWCTAATMASYVVIVALALYLGVLAGLAMTSVEVSLKNLALACGLLVLLGWCFGAFALLLSAATGRTGVVVWGSTGAAIASYFGYTVLMAGGQEEWGWWSPFRAYLYGPALEVGIQWWQPVWLAAVAALLLLAGAPLFARRELRLN